MKIGILTFHAAHNYGAVLQCYALQTYLCSKGHDVSIIDYRQNYLLQCYRWFKFKSIVKSLFHFGLFRSIKQIEVKKLRYDAFQRFIQKYERLAPTTTIQKTPYDYIIIGSDQVWSTRLTNGYDKYYWGYFEKPMNTKVISYAASLELLWPESDDRKVAALLNAFEKISTREEIVAKKIRSLLPNKKVETVVDPTLLLDKVMWSKISEEPKVNVRYVLYYQVRQSQIGKELAEKIAKLKGIKVIVLSASTDLYNSPECYGASPGLFIGLIKNADFIVSSSFHGTVFSIIFEKPFVSINNMTKDSRVKQLLGNLNLSKRLLDDNHFEKDIFLNYKINKNTLYNYLQKSYRYLSEL